MLYILYFLNYIFKFKEVIQFISKYQIEKKKTLYYLINNNLCLNIIYRYLRYSRRKNLENLERIL